MCKIRNKYRIDQIFPSLSLSFHAVSPTTNNRAVVTFSGYYKEGASTLSHVLQYFEARTAVFRFKYWSILSQILRYFEARTGVFRMKVLQCALQKETGVLGSPLKYSQKETFELTFKIRSKHLFSHHGTYFFDRPEASTIQLVL